MKFHICVILSCILESCLVLASPITQKYAKVAENLPASEGAITGKEMTTFNGYIPTAGIGIHKYHNTQKKSWNDARNTCLNEGGHLAVINSAAEEALIVKYMNVTGEISTDQFWIGIHELFQKDQWISVKDERLDAIGYAHWMNGQPDATPNEHCLTITPFGMNDYVCNIALFFVCEM